MSPSTAPPRSAVAVVAVAVVWWVLPAGWQPAGRVALTTVLVGACVVLLVRHLDPAVPVLRAVPVALVATALGDALAVLAPHDGFHLQLVLLAASIGSAGVLATTAFALLVGRDAQRSTTLFADACIIGSALCAVAWLQVAYHVAGHADVLAGLRLFATCMDLTAITVLVLLARRLVHRGARSAPALLAAVVGLVAVDLVTQVPLRSPWLHRDSVGLGAAWLLCWALLAVALARSSLRLPVPAPAPHGTPARTRDAYALGATGLVTPVAYLVADALGVPPWPVLAWVTIATIRFVSLALRSQHLERRIADHLGTDPGTGLADARTMSTRLTVRAAGHPGPGPVLALVHVDGFAQLQRLCDRRDTRPLAQTLAAVLTAAYPEVGRIGLDVFAVVLRHDATAAHAQRLRDQVAGVLELDGLPLRVRVVVGLVRVDPGTSAARLLVRAHRAVAVARNAPDGVGWDDEQADDVPAAGDLLVDLGRAAAAGEIVPDFQAQVRLTDGRVVAAEALVRWHHPTHGTLGPGAFVPVAEAVGATGTITRIVLDAALARCAQWRLDGLPLRVAVNLSARDLADPDLPDTVAAALDRHGLPAAALELEVTETMAYADDAGSGRCLRRLATLGVSLAVDDFGTGHATPDILERHPYTVLKIDRAFVADLRNDPVSRSVATSAVALGHALGLRVVAEGVEDTDTLAAVRELGCDLAQGYLLHRPGAADELARLAADAVAQARR